MVHYFAGSRRKVSPTTSINRQRLGQTSREIRIKPSHHTHIIGEQLQRRDFQQSADLCIFCGEDDHVIESIPFLSSLFLSFEA